MSNDCNYWRVKFGDGFMHEYYIINVYMFVCLFTAGQCTTSGTATTSEYDV